MKTIVAIDPGASGGISFLQDGVAAAAAMPATPQDLFQILHGITVLSGTVKAFVEEVGGYIGGEFQPGSAMFSFGRGFGQIEGILIGLRIPFELIRPQRWQKSLALGTSGRIKGDYTGLSPEAAKEEKRRISNTNAGIKREWKTKLKETAQRLYPSTKVTLKTCDSLLLLEYGRRQENVPPAPGVVQLPGWTQEPQLI